ncbi:unnamed protein product [Gongylonema pulchrum]|uniref:DUF2793 domain-containing protein n=1 Tax=Gongylonema pulchrum TaxID=637853 RepID=A0A183DN95_9BILA|nr:unnamed protein product [Gongylonema pulchrum]
MWRRGSGSSHPGQIPALTGPRSTGERHRATACDDMAPLLQEDLFSGWTLSAAGGWSAAITDPLLIVYAVDGGAALRDVCCASRVLWLAGGPFRA